MRKALAAAISAAWLIAPVARAEMIQWHAAVGNATVSTPDAVQPTSQFVFQGEAAFDGQTVVGVGMHNTTVLYANVTLNSTALPAAPDSFLNVHFTLPVTLTDYKSLGVVGGQSSGTIQVPLTLTDPTVSHNMGMLLSVTGTSGHVTLGAPGDWRSYSVAFAGFNPPGPPGVPGDVLLSMTIVPTTDPPSTTPDPSAAPEPAAVTLAALGLPALALVRRRVRRSPKP